MTCLFAPSLSLPLFAADTATLTLSGRVVSETCSTDIVNKQPQQRCGKNTYLIASQNSVTNARGVITRTVNLPDDASRKIIISSYD
ncbi:DUF2574 family protein [Klebsiella variicola subsp. variicola]